MFSSSAEYWKTYAELLSKTNDETAADEAAHEPKVSEAPEAQGIVMERTSYLTADELQAANKLHQRAPYALCNVSRGFFSISRHYGGCTFQGCAYTYIPGHDECVRDDVLRLVTKLRKKPASKNTEPDEQTGLDFGAYPAFE